MFPWRHQNGDNTVNRLESEKKYSKRELPKLCSLNQPDAGGVGLHFFGDFVMDGSIFTKCLIHFDETLGFWISFLACSTHFA